MSESLTWESDAKAFLESICSDLPFFIRSQARSATADEAVRQARAAGVPAVTRDHVILGMITITPGHMKAQLKALLEKRGVDMATYGRHFQ